MSVFNGGYVYLSIEWVNCVTILLYVCVCVSEIQRIGSNGHITSYTYGR